MAPGCIYISCFERAARSGSGRDSVRGSVGAMNANLSRPDGLATVQSGRKQALSRVCTPGFTHQKTDVSRCRNVTSHCNNNDAVECIWFRDTLADCQIYHSPTIDREPRTVIHVKRAKRFDPMG